MGEPDADGWFPDYRSVPEDLKPERLHVAEKLTGQAIDLTMLSLIREWRIVVADLARHYSLDLYDPAVLARPWPGVRTMIFALLEEPTRLRAALTLKEE